MEYRFENDDASLEVTYKTSQTTNDGNDFFIMNIPDMTNLPDAAVTLAGLWNQQGIQTNKAAMIAKAVAANLKLTQVDPVGAGSSSVLQAITTAYTWVTGATLTPGTHAVAYTGAVSVTGGSGTYSYALANGSSLPAGLSMDSTGHITGTVAAAGTYTFTIVATDTYGQSISRLFTLVMA